MFTKSMKRNPMGLFVFAGLAACGVGAALTSTASGWADTAAAPQATELRLSGVVRDFKERTVSGGHTDFERNPSAGFGHYMNIVNDALDADRKPVFRSTGNKVTTNYRDAQGRNRIAPKSYIAAKTGDVNGALATSSGGQVENAASVAKWFRDIPGTNTSRALEITLKRVGTSNIFSFDDRTDPVYSTRGGFFPVNGELFGNSAGDNKNFHFTFELNTEFTYKRNTGQVFTFTGDDDVWVYVDGKLVIDLGGIHGAVSQTIDMDRLTWLVDNQSYRLDFFFAERHRTQSNFRIDTSIALRRVEPPAISGKFD
jgi:fibro-slime domain-containing protein